MMNEPSSSEPDQADFEERLDEMRAEGQTHRPLQTPAVESVPTSLAEERRAVPEPKGD
jgi:hypothetical protein